MRRPVLRILLNAATVLSLVLCGATVAAWVRSYQACDFVRWAPARPPMQLRIITYRGGLVAKILTPVDRDILWFPGAGWERYAPESYAEKIGSERMLFDRFGFAMANSEDGVYVRRQFACPYWFITLLTAILPSARLVAWRRRARHLRMRPGLCRHCGYDCRATPDRCPECGTPVAAAR